MTTFTETPHSPESTHGALISPAVVEPLPLETLQRLGRRLERQPQNEPIEIVGSTSITAFSMMLPQLAHHDSHFTHLVITPHLDLAQSIAQTLKSFDPQIEAHLLPELDVDVYSNLYPNRRDGARRLGWLSRAQQARGGEIFIGSIKAWLQRSLPYEQLAQNTYRFSPQDELPDQWPLLLHRLGYTSAPLVEDLGSYALRGGLIDIYSPAHEYPVRIELFGDTIESLRFFDPETQRSLDTIQELVLIPTHEVIYTDESRQTAAQYFRKLCERRPVDSGDVQHITQAIIKGQYFEGIEFLLAGFYPKTSLPMDHFSSPLLCWQFDPEEVSRNYDEWTRQLKSDFVDSESIALRPQPQDVFAPLESLKPPQESPSVMFRKIHMEQHLGKSEELEIPPIELKAYPLKEFRDRLKSFNPAQPEFAHFVQHKFKEWRSQGYRIFIAANGRNPCERLRLILEKAHIKGQIVGPDEYLWTQWLEEQNADSSLVHLLPRNISDSVRLSDEGLVFLRDEDFFGRKHARTSSQQPSTNNTNHILNFSDLKPGDFIVHKQHGIGIYEGLKVMPIGGIHAEFIQLSYKDKDKLYLPVYRIGQIQKFSGPSSPKLIDKLGGQNWEKTKSKVKKHLQDVAADLLKLYAQRSQVQKTPYSSTDSDYFGFEAGFPFDETQDQLKAIQDVVSDMTSDRPMDRLICGDVGFGKTEVAMRATFKAVQDGKQVALIAPTTVLTFQHTETFKRRFAKWPVVIRSLNRFVPRKEIQKTLAELKEGRVDIIIGTHRLLSKDVVFKDLGLLICDEEQKFGVKHKERLRKLKLNVDTLAMSATPIPRTLNMSLMGLRDLSIINTPPVDRLPTRTFVCKFDRETIRKAVMSEIGRGGQVFFIHNRIQSIYALADELREFLPDVKMRVAHGQMEEGELEKVMVAFFNHEIDMLICTTIIESGMDIPRANTMFIDQAQQLGLSQLYQLRGRVGRSKQRAYCYLLIPANRRIDAEAQERLKVLQENTALGSGIRIAHYDLELRGAGDLLGEEQSGHINAVGYELYLELLEEAVSELKGEEVRQQVDPDINVRIPAFIPESYINDIRLRLAFYKTLAEIEGPEDIDRIEDDLRDQFGKPPEEVYNLLGLMLIRKLCKDLGIRDLSSGSKKISLAFTEQTPLSPQKVVELTLRSNKKYLLTPDSRLTIRINEISWPNIYEELQYLLSLK